MQRMHQGVYLLGPAPPTRAARARAAAMACGSEAIVSHRSAAELFGLLPERDEDIDVTVAGRNPGPRPGIRLHRVSSIPRQDITAMSGLRVTSLARTICDLAATESPRDCEAAFQEALYRRRDVDRRMEEVLAREPTRRGAPLIRALLQNPRLTRSERERLMLKLIADAQLPKPLTNVRMHGYLLDVYWPAEGLVVEFDGWSSHGHRVAFERDRKRDQVLLAASLRVLRVTDRQLMEEPVALAVRIGQALRAAR